MIRKIRGWIKDKAGVSPIIAIILMVAITVVLAATIYVWVSGMGKGGTSTPSLSLVQTSKNATAISYLVSGVSEPIDKTELTATIGGASATITESDGDGLIEAGETLTLTIGSGTVSVGDEVTIVHTPSGSVIFNAKVR